MVCPITEGRLLVCSPASQLGAGLGPLKMLVQTFTGTLGPFMPNGGRQLPTARWGHWGPARFSPIRARCSPGSGQPGTVTLWHLGQSALGPRSAWR
jgi:hypothetical protein